MKKLFAALLALALALSIAACAAEKPAETAPEKPAASEPKETTPIEEAKPVEPANTEPPAELPEADDEADGTMRFTEVEGVVSKRFEHIETEDDYGEYGKYSDSSDDEYGFDEKGNELYVRTVNSDGYAYENIFTYDGDGNMLTWIVNDETGMTDSTVYEYVGGKNVKITSYSAHFGSEETVNEYEGEKVVKSVTRGEDGETVNTYEYDESGNVIRDVFSSDTGWRTENEFQYSGELLIKVTTVNYTSEGGSQTSVTTYEYDKNGNCVAEETSGEFTNARYNEYDENGNLVRSTYTDEYGTTVSEMTYDENGNLTVEVTTDPEGGVETETFEYDAEGRTIRDETVYTNGVQTNRTLLTIRYE